MSLALALREYLLHQSILLSDFTEHGAEAVDELGLGAAAWLTPREVAEPEPDDEREHPRQRGLRHGDSIGTRAPGVNP